MPGGVAAAFAVLSLIRLALLFRGSASARFSEEERRLRAVGFTGLNRGQARHLFDQGVWIDGKAGEVLTREGLPVTHLFHLSTGAANVANCGAMVALAQAPAFLGEMSVLQGSCATATVTLAADSRFWCVPADALRQCLNANPDIRARIEHRFGGTLAEKLRTANSVIAEPAG